MARLFARECTSQHITIMTESPGSMSGLSTLTAGQLPAVVLSHTVGRSANIHMKMNVPVKLPFILSLYSTEYSVRY